MNDIKEINGVRTALLSWGNPFSCDGSDVIICITGNPGIVDFYDEFCSELHKKTGLPVCVIGYAGHDIIPGEKRGDWKDKQSLYGLQGQLEHKLCFLSEYIDKKSKLHFIGHSIGAWFITELLQKNPAFIERVTSINLLFPTLQEMNTTKSGKHVKKLINFLNFVLFFFTLIHLLPTVILDGLLYAFFKIKGWPSHYKVRTLKYCTPSIAEKVLFLANEELDQVKTLNAKSIDDIKQFTNVIYGESDGWVPLKYMEDLRQFEPPLKLNKVPYSHDYVLLYSKQVAIIVSDFIKSKIM